MPPNHKIFLDASLDLEQILTQYKLLWENLKTEQRQNLYYVDLRIKGKAYVCYKNTACAKEILAIPAPTNTASSTPQTIKK
jgi:cell division septal protein FtsQ